MGRTKEFLEELFAREKTREIEFRGKCHDCGRVVSIVVSLDEEGTLNVSGVPCGTHSRSLPSASLALRNLLCLRIISPVRFTAASWDTCVPSTSGIWGKRKNGRFAFPFQ